MALSDFSVNISYFPSTAQSVEFSWVAPGLKSSPLNARVAYDISEGGKKLKLFNKWKSEIVSLLLAVRTFNLIYKPFDGLLLRNNNAPLPRKFWGPEAENDDGWQQEKVVLHFVLLMIEVSTIDEIKRKLLRKFSKTFVLPNFRFSLFDCRVAFSLALLSWSDLKQYRLLSLIRSANFQNFNIPFSQEQEILRKRCAELK